MNQCYSGSSAPFPLNVGNQIYAPKFELASRLSNEGFNGGVSSCGIVVVLELSVLITCSGDEALDLTMGDAPDVM